MSYFWCFMRKLFWCQKLPGCTRTHFIGTKLQWRAVGTSWSSAFLFWTFLSHVFRKSVHHAEMDQFTCVTVFFLSFFFLTHNVGAHLLRWMFPAKTWTILQRTLPRGSVDWTSAKKGKTVAGFWMAFWISEHKMAHLHFVDYPSNTTCCFFFLIMSKKHPRYNDCWMIMWFMAYCLRVWMCVTVEVAVFLFFKN